MSPFHDSLFTHNCRPVHASNTIIKFADETIMIDIIKNNDESVFRDEVDHMAAWCDANNLLLNTKKTKDIIVDFRRGGDTHQPIKINGVAVECVSDFKFWGPTSQRISPRQETAPTWSRRLTLLSEEEPPILRCLGELLVLHHREHPHQLYYSLAWELLCLRQKGAALLEPHFLQLRTYIRSVVSGEHTTIGKTHITHLTGCLPPCPLGGATGAFRLRPPSSRTASFQQRSPC